MARILLIDDDARILDSIGDILRCEGHEVVTARDGTEGMALYRQHRPDLVITDILMPDKDGLETIQELAGRARRIIVMSGGEGPLDFLADGMEFGACQSLHKPFGRTQLLSAVSHALTI